jgi:hypothetical protein
VPACTGASELVGLDIADTVGHVRPVSKSIVFAAYSTWVMKCLEGCESVFVGAVDVGAAESDGDEDGDVAVEVEVSGPGTRRRWVRRLLVAVELPVALPVDLPWHAVWDNEAGSFHYCDDVGVCTSVPPPSTPVPWRAVWSAADAEVLVLECRLGCEDVGGTASAYCRLCIL